MNAGANPKNIYAIYDQFDDAAVGEVNYGGWLNAINGTPTASGKKGVVALTNRYYQSTGFYGTGDSVFVQVIDPDEDSSGSVVDSLAVTLSSNTELSGEILKLYETSVSSDTFRGWMALQVSGSPTSDGRLQAAYGDSIAVRYDDAHGDYGAPVIVRQRAIFANTVIDTIAGTQHWYASGSPYLLTRSVQVNYGDTLYIHPGVQVRMLANAGSPNQINVYGRLSASGKVDSLIWFRSNAYAAGKGDWGGVALRSSNAHVLNYCRIEHAVNGLTYGNSMNIDTMTVVSNSVISKCSQAGIRLESGNCLKFTGGRIDSCSNAVYRENYWSNGSFYLIRNSVIRNNQGGVSLGGSGSCQVDIRGDSIVGNGGNGLQMLIQSGGASVTGYVKGNYIASNAYGGLSFTLNDSSGSTLTIVVDSNYVVNNNTGGMSGSGIYCSGYALPVIRNNTISNHGGGSGISLSFNGRYMAGLYDTISHNTITGNRFGVNLFNWSRVICQNNNIYDNTTYDVSNGTPNAQDCRYNYWGTMSTDSMNAGGNPKDIYRIYDQYDDASRGEVNYASWVTAPTVNLPPSIVTTGINYARLNTAYAYDVDATDANGDSLLYFLASHPVGMTINAVTGLINWNADSADYHLVQIGVTDSLDTTWQNFYITVTSDTTPPVNNLTLTASAADSSAIELQWDPSVFDSTDMDSIGIWYKASGYPDSANDVTATLVGKFTSWVSSELVTGLAPNTQYYFAAAVRDTSGNWSIISASSKSTAKTLIGYLRRWVSKGGAYWSDPSNWDPWGTPCSTDSVLFDSSSAADCILDSVDGGIRSITMTPAYAGTFDFASESLVVNQCANFNSGGDILPGSGAIMLWTPGITHYLTSRAGDTLPTILVGNGTLALTNPVVAKNFSANGNSGQTHIYLSGNDLTIVGAMKIGNGFSGMFDDLAGRTISADSIRLSGAPGSLLNLTASAPFTLRANSPVEAAYASLRNCAAVSGSGYAGSCLDSGGNTNWKFSGKIWSGHGATANWSDSLNWLPSGRPTSADSALFSALSTKSCLLDSNGSAMGIRFEPSYTGTFNFGIRNLTVCGSFSSVCKADFRSGGDIAPGSGMLTFSPQSTPMVIEVYPKTNDTLPDILRAGMGIVRIAANGLQTRNFMLNSTGIGDTTDWGDTSCVTLVDSLKCASGKMSFANGGKVRVRQCGAMLAGLNGCSSGTGSIEFVKSGGTQILELPASCMLPSIVHSGSGTLKLLSNPLKIAGKFVQDSGSLDLNGRNIDTITGDFSLDHGNATSLIGIAGMKITVGGKLRMMGSPGDSLLLYPAGQCTLAATDSILAQYAIIGNCVATRHSGYAISCRDAGGNGNLAFQDMMPPTILSGTLLSPNGGQIVRGASTLAISWDPAKISDNSLLKQNPISLHYSRDGGATFIGVIGLDLPNSGSCTWTVPSMNNTTMRVRLTVTDSAGNQAMDSSDANFSIDVSAPAVPNAVVQVPAGGEVWAAGSSQTISWLRNMITDNIQLRQFPIGLEYSLDSGATFVSISSGVSNSGTFAWIVPAINSAKVLLRISATDSAGFVAYDTSNVFAIDGTPPAPTTGLTSVILSGTDVKLQWIPSASSDADSVMIRYQDCCMPLDHNDRTLWAELPASANADTITGLSEKLWYRFALFVKDKSGNWSGPDSSAQDSLRIPDSTPPADVTAFDVRWLLRDTIGLSWNAPASADAESIAVRYRTDGIWPSNQNDGSALMCTGNVPMNGTRWGFSENTRYYFAAFVKDSAGNWSAAGARDSVSVPLWSVPAVAVFALAGNPRWTNDRDPAIAISAANIDSMRLALWPDTAGAVWRAYRTLDSISILPGGNGTKIIAGVFKDRYANRTAWYFDTVQFDSVPPASSIETAGAFGPATWPGSIIGNASDDYAGVKEVWLSVQRQDSGSYWDGSAWTAKEQWVPASGGAAWRYGMTPALLPQAAFLVRSSALDSAGNKQAAFAGGQFNYISTRPAAAFAASPTSGAAPLRVQFADSTKNNVASWLWAFGDGDTSSLRDPSHVYRNAGSYSVRLIAAGLGGIDTLTRANYIVVADTTRPAPVAAFRAVAVNCSTVAISWSSSASSDAKSIILRGSASAMPQTRTAGEKSDSGSASRTADTLTGFPAGGVKIYISAFVADSAGNWSTFAAGSADSVRLPDGLPPQNRITMQLVSRGDTAIAIALKIDTALVGDAQRISLKRMYGSQASSSDTATQILPYADTTIVFTHVVKAGTWWLANAVTDAAGNWSAARFDSVQIRNMPPVIHSVRDTTIHEHQSWQAQLTTSDYNGDAMTFGIAQAPAGVGMDGSGLLTWTPAEAGVGANRIITRCTDAANATVLDTIVVTVLNVNDPPQISFSGKVSVPEDSLYREVVSMGDPDAGDSLSVSVRLPSWLRLSHDTLSGTPQNPNVGTDTVAVIVSDKAGLADTVRFALTVVNVNDPPTLVSARIPDSAYEKKAAFIAIRAAEVDAGDSLKIEWVSRPAWITSASLVRDTVKDQWTGSIGGTPRQADVGTALIALAISDRAGEKITIRDTMIVVDTDDPPNTVISKRLIAYGAVQYTVTGVDDYDTVLNCRAMLLSRADSVIIDSSLHAQGTISYYPLRDGRYYFAVGAVDRNGQMDSTPAVDTFTISGATVHTYTDTADWHMIGVPGRGFPVDSLKADGFLSVWNEAAPERDIYGYYTPSTEVASINAGTAYWRKSSRNVTITLQKDNLLDSAMTLQLNKGKYGWNQISSPYPYPVRWPMTSTLWRWNPHTRDFEESPGVLEPWKGYWVLADSASRLVFDGSPDFATPALAKTAATFFAGPSDWRVRISLSDGESQDADNTIGFGESASNGMDQFDRPEPPRMAGQRYLWISRPEWNKPVTQFASDIRRWWTDENVYPLSIAPGTRAAQMTFTGIKELSSVYLFLAGPDTIVPIEEGALYAIAKSDKVTNRALFASRNPAFGRAFPLRFAMGSPYPNPCNPTTTIRYTLPYRWEKNGVLNSSPFRVTMVIYDARGRVIKELVNRTQKPGNYRVYWDGKGLTGRFTGSGAYFCSLKAGKFADVKKLIIAR
jgi:PKD repeat protein